MPKLLFRLHSNHILTRLGLAAVLAAFALGGIAAPAAAQQSEAQKPAEAEVQLAKEVRHVLVTQPFYTLFDNLEYKVEGKTVTLTGQVYRPVLKLDVVRAVKGIHGVGMVIDKIEVLPVSPMDNRIRRAVYRSIYSAPGMEKYAIQAVPPIHIIVKNGHVTLIGVVLDQADKNLANVRAHTVKDVFSVTNKLRVEKRVEKK